MQNEETNQEHEMFKEKFRQLWMACYFENRLTRNVIRQIDLKALVDDLIAYLES